MLDKDAPTTATFIPVVMSTSNCKKHKADVEEPCYMLNGGRGVCNARAKRAGFNHPVSDKAKLNRLGSAESRRKGR